MSFGQEMNFHVPKLQHFVFDVNEGMVFSQKIKTKNDWLVSTSDNLKVLLPYLLSKSDPNC